MTYEQFYFWMKGFMDRALESEAKIIISEQMKKVKGSTSVVNTSGTITISPLPISSSQGSGEGTCLY